MLSGCFNVVSGRLGGCFFGHACDFAIANLGVCLVVLGMLLEETHKLLKNSLNTWKTTIGSYSRFSL